MFFCWLFVAFHVQLLLLTTALSKQGNLELITKVTHNSVRWSSTVKPPSVINSYILIQYAEDTNVNRPPGSTPTKVQYQKCYNWTPLMNQMLLMEIKKGQLVVFCVWDSQILSYPTVYINEARGLGWFVVGCKAPNFFCYTSDCVKSGGFVTSV